MRKIFLVSEGLDQKIIDYYIANFGLMDKENQMDKTQELIDKLTKAISFKFKEDSTSPNLTISKLRHGYYCSVVRYAKTGTGKHKKVVVCKANSSDLGDSIRSVALAFLKIADPQPDPLQELSKLTIL